MSKSTVSNWFKDKAFSKKIAKANAEKAAKANKARISLLNKGRQAARVASYKEATRAADTEYRNYKHNPLFIAGLMLYMTQGDATHPHRILLSSRQLEQHKIFLNFSRQYLGVEKSQIKFWLLLPSRQLEKDCVALWSKALKISPTNFYKNQIAKGRSTARPLQSGVGNTIIGNTVLKVKLNRWTELMMKDLAK